MAEPDGSAKKHSELLQRKRDKRHVDKIASRIHYHKQTEHDEVKDDDPIYTPPDPTVIATKSGYKHSSSRHPSIGNTTVAIWAACFPADRRLTKWASSG